MTRAVLFGTNIGDINANLAFTNNYAATTDPGVSNDSSQGYTIGSVWVNTSGGKAWTCTSAAVGAATWVIGSAAIVTAPVAGVASGYKVARGVHQQAAASDTIVTGLATVVAAVVSWRDAPTVKQLFINASIGDQAGAPAAGSILVRTYKPTAVNDVTPTAATDFTDNLSSNWIAIGT